MKVKKKVQHRFNKMRGWPHNIKWWFLHRFHPKHRYHIINTGLGPGWRDTDVLMEHLIVKLFIDFIEKEKPHEVKDLSQTNYPEDWKKIQQLYLVFKQQDPLAMKYDELTPLLTEIIQLRKHFWT